MEAHAIRTDPKSDHAIGSVVHVARDGAYCGFIVISDTVKETAADAITSLRRLGIHKTVMLTGDRREAAERIAAALSIDSVSPELLPADKVTEVDALLKRQSGGKALAFVGDGINDAPVLARADVGIAMGAFGSDAAIEAADIVLMDDDPARIADAIRIARKTIRIVRQNIVLAISVKVLVMLLAAVGFASLWLAVFADVGIAVIAILNAMRTMASRTHTGKNPTAPRVS
jgi:Cd2+/Zn2+-exporting ATPase